MTARSRKTDRGFLERAEQDDDLAALIRGVIAVGLHERDFAFAHAFCVRLARHWHYNVRGNALQALGHLLRAQGHLDLVTVRLVIDPALVDESEYVRSEAEDLLAACEALPGWSPGNAAGA